MGEHLRDGMQEHINLFHNDRTGATSASTSGNYLLVFLPLLPVAQGRKQRIPNPRPIWRHHQDLHSPNLPHQEKCPLVWIAAAPTGGTEEKHVIWTHS